MGDNKTFMCTIKTIKRLFRSKRVIRSSHLSRSYFTALELLAAMTVFIILLLATSMFFTASQKAWIKSSDNSMTFENVRIAMELMTRELQSIYYRENKIPFWHKSKSGTDGYSNQSLNFVSNTNVPQEGVTTNLSEVKYQLWYTADPTEDSAGWLMRSVTGDNSSKWNFYDNLTVGLTGASNAFTANNDSSEGYQKLIPYVTNLTFTCYDDGGFPIDSTINAVTELPISIEINLSLMDNNSWQKWIGLGGTPQDLGSDPASDFRKRYERTFKKTVIIGNRGQYE